VLALDIAKKGVNVGVDYFNLTGDGAEEIKGSSVLNCALKTIGDLCCFGLSVSNGAGDANFFGDTGEQYYEVVVVNSTVMKESEENDKHSQIAAAHFDLGVLQMNKGSTGHAIDSFKSSVNADPEFASAWNALGCAYRKKENDANGGDGEKNVNNALELLAQHCFHRCLDLDSHNAAAHANLALLSASQEGLSGASSVEKSLDALAQITDDPVNWIVRGVMEEKKGNMKASDNAYRAALQVDVHPCALVNAGAVNVLLGEVCDENRYNRRREARYYFDLFKTYDGEEVKGAGVDGGRVGFARDRGVVFRKENDDDVTSKEVELVKQIKDKLLSDSTDGAEGMVVDAMGLVAERVDEGGEGMESNVVAEILALWAYFFTVDADADADADAAASENVKKVVAFFGGGGGTKCEKVAELAVIIDPSCSLAWDVYEHVQKQ